MSNTKLLPFSWNIFFYLCIQYCFILHALKPECVVLFYFLIVCGAQVRANNWFQCVHIFSESSVFLLWMERSKSESVTQSFLHSRPVIAKNSKHLSLAWANKSHFWKMYLLMSVSNSDWPKRTSAGFHVHIISWWNLWSYYWSQAAIETWKHLIFVYLALPLSLYLPHYGQGRQHWGVCYPAACYGGLRFSSFSVSITEELLVSNWCFSLSSALIDVSL